MAHTASRTSVGFEPIYNKSLGAVPNPVEYELTPNTAFSRGDMVVLTAGKIAKAAANATNVIGVMAESFTTATNPSGSITKGKVYDHPDNVYRCSFTDQTDSTATGGGTDNLIDTALSTSSNDVWNGALLYVYAGTNAGCIRTVSDYVGADDKLVVTTPFPASCDTTTKYIILGLAGEANDVINIGLGGVNLKDENTIDANAARLSSGVKQGPLVPLDIDPANLMMDVIVRRSCHFMG